MSCLSIDAWHETFLVHANNRTDAGKMASTLTCITGILADDHHTPERKIILIEKLFDQMALTALEATDGTG